MTARKRKKKRGRKKKLDINLKKVIPYSIGIAFFLFILYRLIVLLNFKVNCSTISKENLSTNSAVVNTLFVFEEYGKIVDLELIIYSKDQKNILRIDIPTNIYVTEEGVDSFPITSTNSVGEFLKHDSGKEYTLDYISNLLGVKFDNYVWVVNSNTTTDDFLSTLSVWSILSNLKYSRDLKGNLYSNLPILNLIKEVNFVNQVLGNYQYEEMDILDCCVEEFVISSTRTQLRFNSRSFDNEFSKYIKGFVSRDVERERVNVEVYNASNISGLASEYARKIRHTGSRILRFDNAPTMYEETIIYVPEPEGYVNSLLLIRDVVGEEVEVVNERPSFVTTGDIVVVLGKDIVK